MHLCESSICQRTILNMAYQLNSSMCSMQDLLMSLNIIHDGTETTEENSNSS